MAARMPRVYKLDSTARTPSPQRSLNSPAKDFSLHRSTDGLTKARSMKLRKTVTYKAEERRESSHLLRSLREETVLCPLKNTAIMRAWRQSPKQKCTICLLSGSVSPKKKPQTPTSFFLPPPFNGIFSPAERIRLAQLTPKPD